MKSLKKYNTRELLLLSGALMSMALLVLIFRIRWTMNLYYTFLVWNLILAFLPVIFAYLMRRYQENRLLFLVFGVLWMSFLPNSAYIVTDFKHIMGDFNWLDCILIGTYASIGLFYGLISMLWVHRLLLTRLSNKVVWSTMVVITFLSALGIYLGRFIRWNSWDLINQPSSVISDVMDLFLAPWNNWFAWKFIVVFSLSIGVSYVLFHKVIGWFYAEED